MGASGSALGTPDDRPASGRSRGLGRATCFRDAAGRPRLPRCRSGGTAPYRPRATRDSLEARRHDDHQRPRARGAGARRTVLRLGQAQRERREAKRAGDRTRLRADRGLRERRQRGVRRSLPDRHQRGLRCALAVARATSQLPAGPARSAQQRTSRGCARAVPTATLPTATSCTTRRRSIPRPRAFGASCGGRTDGQDAGSCEATNGGENPLPFASATTLRSTDCGRGARPVTAEPATSSSPTVPAVPTTRTSA